MDDDTDDLLTFTDEEFEAALAEVRDTVPEVYTLRADTVDESRAKAMAWMEGWRCGAAFLPIPDNQSADFFDGWREGRAAKRAAAATAEAKYGYTFQVVKPAVSA